MNASQLATIGFPEWVISRTLLAVRQMCLTDEFPRSQLKKTLQDLLKNPERFLKHEQLSAVAIELHAENDTQQLQPSQIRWQSWARDADEQTISQMENACRIPAARQAALMPDAHLGYGLPIGGVLATEDVVIPYAVGVDIACRMKLSVLDLPPETLSTRDHVYRDALMAGTVFGIGCTQQTPQQHAVLDEDWSVSKVTNENRDRAWKQLGTSGSGNHFVEFGTLRISEPQSDLPLAPGNYVALLSHSGSRGTGAAVCQTYSKIAQRLLPRSAAQFGRLAWLPLQSEAGQEYWAAMNLMGKYAAANHDVIHRRISQLLGAEITAGVENHHNFAWREHHDGRDLIVHRKGATPAARGELGVIPGSMADPAWIVRGRGNPQSLRSASHGAGRVMSRRQGKRLWDFDKVRQELLHQGIHVLAAGADEVPGVYRNIANVMAAQQDLVDSIARFDPKIVRMCGDGSQAED